MLNLLVMLFGFFGLFMKGRSVGIDRRENGMSHVASRDHI
jgi:hypothetical protein